MQWLYTILAIGFVYPIIHSQGTTKKPCYNKGRMICFKYIWVTETVEDCSMTKRRRASIDWTKPTPTSKPCPLIYRKVEREMGTLSNWPIAMDVLVGVFHSPHFPELRHEHVKCRVKVCGPSSDSRYSVKLLEQYMKPEDIVANNCLKVKGKGWQCNGMSLALMPVETNTHKLIMEFRVETKTNVNGTGGVNGLYEAVGANGESLAMSDMFREDLSRRQRSIRAETRSGSTRTAVKQADDVLSEVSNPTTNTTTGRPTTDVENDDFFDDDFGPDKCDSIFPFDDYKRNWSRRYQYGRIYFNAASGKCECIFLEYAYALMCDKSDQENCFPNFHSCQKQCLNVCGLSKSRGYGYAWQNRFYYNAAHNQCSEFLYRGMGGTGNNFVTKNECELRCKQTMKDTEMMEDLKDITMHSGNMAEFESNPRKKWLIAHLKNLPPNMEQTSP
eukprot:m.309219 g.309219  ORF g.309219 m.309219 type:complete len:444 (+) comp45809_c0_seq1:55-1386(+)